MRPEGATFASAILVNTALTELDVSGDGKYRAIAMPLLCLHPITIERVCVTAVGSKSWTLRGGPQGLRMRQ
jgi:hypothetical protein